MQERERATIRGVLTPQEWDKRGTPVSVAIVTDEFEKYYVARTPRGDELLDLLFERVEAEGFVGRDLRGSKEIEVQDYRLIGEKRNSAAEPERVAVE